MTAVLGIDAAWTERQPSGVALVTNDMGRWHCVAVAPSYATFVALANGNPYDWERDATPGSMPDPSALLAAAGELLGGAPVDVVAVDMPLATVAITGRREADQAISRTFGGRWCGTHTPSALRPGPIGERLHQGFAAAGFPLVTCDTPAGSLPALVEVYPHPALLTLVGAAKRLEYKLSKRRRYWPDAAPAHRIARLLAVWRTILISLEAVFGHVPLAIPTTPVPAKLKHLEDMLDAIVCAWVGIEYVAGRSTSYGDGTAAIWCP